MSDKDNSKSSSLGTLAGWGAVLTGVAALLGVILSNNNQNNNTEQDNSGVVEQDNSGVVEQDNSGVVELQDFESDTYLYGKIGAPNDVGNKYVFFEKKNDYIIGIAYTRNSGDSYCFNGTANKNSIINVTKAIPPLPGLEGSQWEYQTKNKMNLLGDYPYKLPGTPPDFADRGLQECVDAFTPKN